MAGGLFAIQRKYYRQMGEYDAGLDTWGGENLEMSFRVRLEENGDGVDVTIVLGYQWSGKKGVTGIIQREFFLMKTYVVTLC